MEQEAWGVAWHPSGLRHKRMQEPRQRKPTQPRTEEFSSEIKVVGDSATVLPLHLQRTQ